jgi:hypothetical protein
LPTIDTKQPDAEACLTRRPHATLHMTERDFRYVQDLNRCVPRPGEESVGRARLTFSYDLSAKAVLEMRGLSNGNFSKSYACPPINADASVPAWRSVVDLHSFTKIVVLPVSWVDIASLPEPSGAVYFGFDTGALKAHAFLARV